MIQLPSDFSPKERQTLAMSLFKDKGYNCCQSVLLAFADVLESNKLATKEVLAIIGSGFGGGTARMREVCGSFNGAAMMAGFIRPADNPQEKQSRNDNYSLIQEMAREFKELNGGSIICRELLGITRNYESVAQPQHKTKLPCSQIIGNAALIVAERLEKEVSRE